MPPVGGAPRGGVGLAEVPGLGLPVVRTFGEGELGGRMRLLPVERGTGTMAGVWVPAARLVGPWGDANEPTT